MRVPGSFAVIEAATGLIARDVRDRPFKADTLAAARATVAKALGGGEGEEDAVLAEEGLQVVPLNYALEEAYKAVRPKPKKKVKLSRGKVFRVVAELINAHAELDAIGLSAASHDLGGYFVQFSTAQPRLSDFANDGLIEALPKTNTYDPAKLEREGYPPKVCRPREGDAPRTGATPYRKTEAWDAWWQSYQNFINGGSK